MADEGKNKKGVEVGVLEECPKFLLQSRYFPSKLGGKPSWLDLRNLPKNLTCGVCLNPCIFLCQLYAPIDDKPECHHRTLFVFICPNDKCCRPGENKNLKVFRCQLYAINEFYPVEDPIEEEDWHPECSVERFSKVCQICGNPAPFSCGKCKTTFYCTKLHQVTDWKQFGHKLNCENSTSERPVEHSILFPEFDISIETLLENVKTIKKEEEALKEYENLVSENKTGTLNGVSDETLESFCSGIDDKVFTQFKATINYYPEQVLRYDRGGKPLFITKPTITEDSIPHCEFCEGPRQFEFQILSTILNEVIENEKLNGIDFGTLIVYTCKNSCNRGPSYKEEYIYKQDVVE